MHRIIAPLVLAGLCTAGVSNAATLDYGQDETFPGFSAIQRGKGLSLHKDNYILPATWNREWNGAATEAIFQLSVKQRLPVNNLYFAYTQKSFWQAYNHKISAPFREANYNPEVFYRWLPGDDMFRRWHLDRWGFDAGIEHESNGRTWPESRSWNRGYFAPFRSSTEGNSLWYLKAWYRFPENQKNDATDQGGDDNPDIYRFYGWTEAHYQREFDNHLMVHAMARGNLASGKGAGELRLTLPANEGAYFWVFSLFSGYGENLADYNHETTRIGIGVAFNR